MRVGIMGSHYHSSLLSQLLKEAGIESEEILISRNVKGFFSKVKTKDIIHIIYSHLDAFTWLLCILFLKLLRKKVIMHWIGSDVYSALTERKSKVLTLAFSSLADTHLASAPWLIKELKMLGIEAAWLPLVPTLNIAVNPLPEKFRALIYLPETKYNFYNGPLMEKLARDFPSINFFVVGNETSRNDRSNIQFLGHVKNMEEVYKETSVLVRIPRHDGLSLMVLEALASGRHVIYNHKFPNCFYAKTYQDACEALDQIMKNESINLEGVEYIKKKLWKKANFRKNRLHLL